jgi:steroid 5-alpha reductase family enzyme
MHHRIRSSQARVRTLTHTWSLQLVVLVVVLILSSCSPFPGLPTPFTTTCTCTAFAASHTHVSIPTKSMKPPAIRDASSRSSVMRSKSSTKLHAFAPITGFVNGPFVQSSIVFAGCNAVGWLISLVTKSHLHLDLIGTGAFAAVGILPLITGSSRGILASGRIKLSSALVTVWGTKLAGFLFFRVMKTGHDARLDELLSTTSGASEFLLHVSDVVSAYMSCSCLFVGVVFQFTLLIKANAYRITIITTASFWVFSLLWGLVASLPHTLGTTSLAPGLPLTSYCGCTLYAIGFAFESLADVQKWTFKQGHPGQFCNVGVWSLSQHPNWFGNLAIWSGIFLINAPALIENVGKSGSPLHRLWGARRLLLALLSPVFLWALFNAQASGNLTSALELANKKYGHDPAYLEYVANTPLIVPNPLKWFL